MYSAKNQPHRIIIKPLSYLIISFLRQRLILVITTTIRKLCRCNINNTLTSSFWYLMNKANQVLIRISKPHATPYTTLKI